MKAQPQMWRVTGSPTKSVKHMTRYKEHKVVTSLSSSMLLAKLESRGLCHPIKMIRAVLVKN